jgi:ABC-type multidrug transport system ATPase subunit
MDLVELTPDQWRSLGFGIYASGIRSEFLNPAEVMDLVELTPLAMALVGLPGVSGLSVEQRKRLTIAVELVSNPAIVFMDEPTSGAYNI